jgi:ribosomal protein S18 acetylase RimI-like enzyme
MISPVEIRLGLPAVYRHQAASLCYETFRPKFEPILDSPEHGIAILEAGLKSDLILMAVQQDRLAGVVGLEYDGHYFFDLKRAAFVREFGWLRGLIKMILLIPFARHHHEGDLTIGAIAVHASGRGQGVGTQLLQAVFDYAREKGFHSVSLEVVDTNPGARRLYERLGFVATKTRQYPFLRQIMGFSAATTMFKEFGLHKNQ